MAADRTKAFVEDPNEESQEVELDSQETSESAEDLAEKNREREAAIEKELQDELSSMAGEIESSFLERVGRRGTKDQQMLKAISLYYGSSVVSPASFITQDRPFGSAKTGKRAEEFNIVKTKVDLALSQGIAAQFGGGEKNWDIFPSKEPVDENGAPVDKVAVARAAEKMENIIEDQLDDCSYGAETRAAMWDRYILGTAVMKGPNNALNHVKRYQKVPTSGGKTVAKAVLKTRKVPSAKRVNPWFFYPDDSVLKLKDADDTIEVHFMNASKLVDLALSEDSGFSDFRETIFEVIKESAQEQPTAQSYMQFVGLSGNSNAFKNKYVVLEYHGPIGKSLLDKLSIEPTYESPENRYYGEVWVVNGKIIRVSLSPIDGCYDLGYALCTWEDDPGHMFGIGLPIFIGDQQNVINKTYKMLLDNATISSGPQVIMNKELIEPATPQEWELKPDKIWYYTDMADGDIKKAIDFFTVPNVTQQLTNIITLARGFAEEESGVPLIAGGLAGPQVVDNATGAQLQQQSATVMSDYKNEAWDDNITKPVIQWFHDWNWEYGEDDSIKADFDIDVKTSSEYRNKLLQIKDLEKLSLEGSQNPQMGDLLNMPEIQRARISMMCLPSSNLVKTDEQIAQEQQAKANQPDPQMIELQIKQQELQVKQQEAQIKQTQLQFEMAKFAQEQQLEQQRALWEHQEKMGAVYARVQESQSQVLAAESARQTEMYKLAQADEVDRMKILADLQKSNQDDQREKFLAGIDHANELRKYLLQEQEMKLAQKEGHGALSTI